MFVLMSGYLSSRRLSSHAKRVLSLWVQSVFYGLLIMCVGFVTGLNSFSPRLLLQVLSPLVHRTWWFLSDFVAATLLFPLADVFVARSSKGEVGFVSLSIVCLLSVVSTLGHFITTQDAFTLHLGYSSMWFVALYTLGSCLKAYEDKVRLTTPSLLAGMILSTIFTWWWKLWGGLYLQGLLGNDTSDVFLNYTSPTVLMSALCLVLAFSRLQFSLELPRRILSVCAPLSFGVYLLSDHPSIREWAIASRFAYIGELGPAKAVLSLVAAVLMVLVVGLLVDWIRNGLFSILGIQTRITTLVNRTKLRVEANNNTNT